MTFSCLPLDKWLSKWSVYSNNNGQCISFYPYYLILWMIHQTKSKLSNTEWYNSKSGSSSMIIRIKKKCFLCWLPFNPWIEKSLYIWTGGPDVPAEWICWLSHFSIIDITGESDSVQQNLAPPTSVLHGLVQTKTWSTDMLIELLVEFGGCRILHYLYKRSQIWFQSERT